MDLKWTDEEAANLAWRQVITVMESIVPPEVFRPAQAYYWQHKPELPSAIVLAATIRDFATDAAFRDWVQHGALLEEIFTLWSAIGELNRDIYLLDEGEAAPKELVDAIRAAPGARSIFCLALGLWRP
jgi:hypothetical protein